MNSIELCNIFNKRGDLFLLAPVVYHTDALGGRDPTSSIYIGNQLINTRDFYAFVLKSYKSSFDDRPTHSSNDGACEKYGNGLAIGKQPCGYIILVSRSDTNWAYDFTKGKPRIYKMHDSYRRHIACEEFLDEISDPELKKFFLFNLDIFV